MMLSVLRPLHPCTDLLLFVRLQQIGSPKQFFWKVQKAIQPFATVMTDISDCLKVLQADKNFNTSKKDYMNKTTGPDGPFSSSSEEEAFICNSIVKFFS